MNAYRHLCPNLSKCNRCAALPRIRYQKHQPYQTIRCCTLNQNRRDARVRLCSICSKDVSYPARKIEQAEADQSRNDNIENDGERIVWRAKVDGFPIEEVAPWFTRDDELDDGERWRVS